MDSYSIIIKPHVTEKTMNLIDLNNEISFVVNRTANKKQIKRAFEELYGEEVARVNTHITTKGVKVAYIKLVEEEMAEEIAVRLGVF
ncbi:50S ribosomal protein L23 [uncultured Methanobrevibacter sp.]|uniref:50S ribosomal protein L23 n=1 Tax=uncultured Methanobrevibacter sp. TaxID=253161 RepID=UPI0025CD8138|nr:50S ribosomal protein L23 [uncultured Methanobrevibacter sp.]